MSIKNCPWTRIAGLQNADGYHIKIKCSKCDATGIFFNENKEDIRVDEDFNFDKTKFSCPNEEYLASLQKQPSNQLQIKKGSIVKTSTFQGTIIKYSSNKEITLQISIEDGGNYSEVICKEEIIEVIKY